MKDRIIQVFVGQDDIFGLSESGTVYILVQPTKEQKFTWTPVAESPDQRGYH